MRLLLILAVTLILFLALALAYPDVMIKPGKLSEGHRSLERDCFGCHAPIRGASSVSCLSCHKLEGIGRVSGVLLLALRSLRRAAVPLVPIALALIKRNVPVDAPLLVDEMPASQEVVVDPEVGLHVRPKLG